MRLFRVIFFQVEGKAVFSIVLFLPFVSSLRCVLTTTKTFFFYFLRQTPFTRKTTHI